MVRLPLNVEGVLHTIANATNDFMQKHQRLPSVDELAAITNVDPEKIGQVLKSHGPHTSIDTPLQSGEDTTIADTIQADSKWSPDKEADSKSLTDELCQVMQKVLKEREMTIVRYCFGIGCPEKGLEEIGDLFNLTRERVRQIRERCILKLKGSDQAHILAKYLG